MFASCLPRRDKKLSQVSHFSVSRISRPKGFLRYGSAAGCGINGGTRSTDLENCHGMGGMENHHEASAGNIFLEDDVQPGILFWGKLKLKPVECVLCCCRIVGKYPTRGKPLRGSSSRDGSNCYAPVPLFAQEINEPFPTNYFLCLQYIHVHAGPFG